MEHPQTCTDCKELIFGSEIPDQVAAYRLGGIWYEFYEGDAPNKMKLFYYHGECYDDLKREKENEDKMDEFLYEE